MRILRLTKSNNKFVTNPTESLIPKRPSATILSNKKPLKPMVTTTSCWFFELIQTLSVSWQLVKTIFYFQNKSPKAAGRKRATRDPGIHNPLFCLIISDHTLATAQKLSHNGRKTCTLQVIRTRPDQPTNRSFHTRRVKTAAMPILKINTVMRGKSSRSLLFYG